VDSDKKEKLDKTITDLQDRWGAKAVHRLQGGETPAYLHVSTGFPNLDEALTIGGIPRGRISEIIGVPTSGMATMALKIVASDQELANAANPSGAIYIDPSHTFDPDYAARCGLVLDQLILVRPHDIDQALDIMSDLIMNGGITTLVFDAPSNQLEKPQPSLTLARTLDRLIAPLSQTNCILLFLTSLPVKATNPPPGNPPPGGSSTTLDDYPPNITLPHHASMRLFIERERWIYKKRDIHGYQAHVLVVKNKFGPAGKQATINFTFAGDP